MIATTLPTKKMLLRTRLMVTKTEDSLVLVGRGETYTIFRFVSHLFQTFSFGRFIFYFRDWFSEFRFHLGRLFICSRFTFQFHRRLIFALWCLWANSAYLQKHFHGVTFSLCAISSQMPWSQRFLAMMNRSEPFLFLLTLWFAPMFCAFPFSFSFLLLFQPLLLLFYLLGFLSLLRLFSSCEFLCNTYIFHFLVMMSFIVQLYILF